MEETLLLPIKIDTRDVVYCDRNQTIRHVVAQFDGFSKEYFVGDHGERAAVVAVKDGAVLLARQYRLIINGIALEIPGGGIKPDEGPCVAAARECLEETGVRCRDLKLLLRFHPSLDICRNLTHVFWSESCDESSEDRNDRRVWIPLERCIEMIFSGEIIDSLSIIALLGYHVARGKGPALA